MKAFEEIATEQWTIRPHGNDTPHMFIMSGTYPILRNVNLEEEEMQAITALPELFALALAVIKGGASYNTLFNMAADALKKAAATDEQEG